MLTMAPPPHGFRTAGASARLAAAVALSESRLSVSIVGGGPVGLLLALRLVEFPGGGLLVSVTVFDERWVKGTDGKYSWAIGSGEDWLEEASATVLTLPDDVVELLGASCCGDETLRHLSSGERIWPRSRNVSTARLQEALLQRVQEADVCGSINLAVGPPADLREALRRDKAPEEADLAALHTWLEALDGSPVALADGPLADLARAALGAELCGSGGGVGSDMGEVLVVSIEEGEVPSQSRLLSMALSCSQPRYFYNPDGVGRSAQLGIRLLGSEAVLLAKAFGWESEPSTSRARHALYRRGSNNEELASLERLLQAASGVRDVFHDGLAMFGLQEGQVASVSLVSAGPTSSMQAYVGTMPKGAKVCCLMDSGSCAGVEAWPHLDTPCAQSGESCGRVCRGTVGGFEAAGALAGILHADAPPRACECFMQGRRRGTGSPRPFGQATTSVEAASVEQVESLLVGRLAFWIADLSKDLNAGGEGAVSSPSAEEIRAAGAAAKLSDASLALLQQALSGGGGGSGCGPEPEGGRAGVGAWLAALRAGAEASPSAAFAVALRARAALESGEPLQALALLSPTSETSGSDDVQAPPRSLESDSLARVVRAEAYLRVGLLEKALQDCEQALSLDPEGSQALMVRGEVHLRMGHFAEAVQDCDLVVDREPSCVSAYAVRGEARLRLGRAEEALMDCEWALAHGRRAATVLAVRGEAHRHLGSLREAICDCEEALRENAACAEALGVRGQARLDLGDMEAALADLSRAIEVGRSPIAGAATAGMLPAPSSSTATSPTFLARWLVARGEAQVTLHNYAEAIQDCSEALSLQNSASEVALARAVRGEANLLSGNWEAALADCDEALSREPADAYTLAVRGQANLLLGNKEEAVRDTDEALDICPKMEYAARVRDRAWSQLRQA